MGGSELWGPGRATAIEAEPTSTKRADRSIFVLINARSPLKDRKRM
jgi:hypothetical protein